MAWIILGIAVFTEIIWALSLKWAATTGTWQSAIVPIVLSFLNMALLALAMRDIPRAPPMRSGPGSARSA